jgi:hypothetical protein
LIKVYLAIPYSGVDKEESFKIANACAAVLMKDDMCVFSPISHSHSIAKQEQLPKNWEFWRKIDTEFIKFSDVIVIVTLEGWRESTGVTEETCIAREFGKNIYYMNPYTFKITINPNNVK